MTVTGSVLIYYLLLIVGLLCLFAAFLRYRENGPVTIGWLGMCFWLLAVIIFGAGPK